ncbi:hypothetical protein FrCorBMG51_11640 [Protofrankia coriariae]|uniref:Uncharacterized protein n=1 Tax=Protofrankia coriariae TaxID=1562887 RepID=A0ABR5F3V2_9ACTN|nr:hypothetical protein FrCorBMG51_11640 [Protofrankia coriariae]
MLTASPVTVWAVAVPDGPEPDGEPAEPGPDELEPEEFEPDEPASPDAEVELPSPEADVGAVAGAGAGSPVVAGCWLAPAVAGVTASATGRSPGPVAVFAPTARATVAISAAKPSRAR